MHVCYCCNLLLNKDNFQCTLSHKGICFLCDACYEKYTEAHEQLAMDWLDGNEYIFKDK